MKKKILILVSILVVFLAIPPFVNYWVSTPSPIGFIPIEKQEVWISFYDQELYPTLRFLDSDNQFAQKEQIPVEVVYAYIEAKIDA